MVREIALLDNFVNPNPPSLSINDYMLTDTWRKLSVGHRSTKPTVRDPPSPGSRRLHTPQPKGALPRPRPHRRRPPLIRTEQGRPQVTPPPPWSLDCFWCITLFVVDYFLIHRKLCQSVCVCMCAQTDRVYHTCLLLRRAKFSSCN